MKFDRLDRMTGGWFIGAFSPTLVRTDAFEVAVKHYRSGDREALHEHRLATEVTLVVAGEVHMAGRTLKAGDIVLLEPGEATAFVALAESTTVCVKFPSVPGDKHVRDD